jgi:hypothetical protein
MTEFAICSRARFIVVVAMGEGGEGAKNISRTETNKVALSVDPIHCLA